MKRSQTGNGLALIQRAITFKFFFSHLQHYVCPSVRKFNLLGTTLPYGGSKGFFVAVVFVKRWKITVPDKPAGPGNERTFPA